MSLDSLDDWVVFGVLLFAVCDQSRLACDAQETRKDGTDVLLSIKDGFTSNRAGFAKGWGRFELRTGTVRSVTDVLNEKWTADFEAKVFWAFDGKMCRYDTIYSPDAIRLTVPSNLPTTSKTTIIKVSGPITSARAITDGAKTLVDIIGAEGNHQVEITEGTSTWPRSTFSPLSLGLPDLGSPELLPEQIIAAISGGELEIAYLGEEQYQGRTVSIVQLKKRGLKGEVRYWIDVERGAIPLRLTETMEDGTPYLDVRYEDLREFSGSRWLPQRLISMQTFGDQTSVRELRAVELEVDKPLGAEALRIAFEKKTKIRDMVRSVGFEVEPNTYVGLNPLPPVPAGAQQYSANAMDKVAFDPMATEKPKRNWWLTVSILTIALIVGTLLARKVYRHLAT